MDSERIYLYLLNNLPGISNKKIAEMYRASGSFSEAYRRDKKDYLELGIFSGKGRSYGYDDRLKKEGRLMAQYEELGKRGIRLCCFWDNDYPRRLRGLPDAPMLLYVRGELPREDRPSAAIIGGRRCSGYGSYAAGLFAEALSDKGVSIISGMAEGIDSAALRACLRRGHKAYAVLGSGVSYCYPAGSFDIYEAMCEGEGGVISESPPGAGPDPWRFVSRNRIIAGLCDALIVAEARKRSGTAITVEHALAYGREVYAVPHRICDALGEGSNGLIKDGAQIITEPEDLLCRFDIEEADTGARHEKSGPSLASSEKIVYSCLDFNQKHLEEVAAVAGLSIPETIRSLQGLEKKGLAASGPAAYYRKVN